MDISAAAIAARTDSFDPAPRGVLGPGSRLGPRLGAGSADLTRRVPAWLVSRPWRVGALGLAVLLMAAADLVMTIEFLTVGAMWEGNPLARSVMSSGSAGALTAWKVASLIPAAYVMTRHGGRLIVELAAWVCFLAMAIVMVRWSIYCGITDTMSFIDSSLAAASDPDWVSWQR